MIILNISSKTKVFETTKTSPLQHDDLLYFDRLDKAKSIR